MKSKTTLTILSVLLLKLFACADLPGRFRQHTYPPGFHYISEEIRELVKSFQEAAIHHAELLRELGTMEQAVVEADGLPIIR